MGGKGILPGTVNKQARAGWRGQQPGAGKLVRVAEGGNSTGEGGRPTSHMSCKQTCWLAGAAVHAQQAGVGKLVKAAVGGKLHKRGGKTHFPHEL
jgi:hypothetical protein